MDSFMEGFGITRHGRERSSQEGSEQQHKLSTGRGGFWTRGREWHPILGMKTKNSRQKELPGSQLNVYESESVTRRRGEGAVATTAALVFGRPYQEF